MGDVVILVLIWLYGHSGAAERLLNRTSPEPWECQRPGTVVLDERPFPDGTWLQLPDGVEVYCQR